MTDITLKDYDLVIENGDFKIQESSQQETDLIINLFQGNLFEYPLCGVGILNYLAGSESALVIEQLIKTQLTTDGFTVESVSIEGTTIESLKIQVFAHR